MFLVEIDGIKTLYTEDYSREQERHLQRAEVPGEFIDILIDESTYGTQCHEDRGAREARFCNDVYKIVMASPGMLQNGLSRDLFDR